jgi:hypothetical protein
MALLVRALRAPVLRMVAHTLRGFKTVGAQKDSLPMAGNRIVLLVTTGAE